MAKDTPNPSAGAPLYLTTREVADLLRVKERKVYDLAAAGEIPHRRITGKLLFPRQELMAWIDGSGHGVVAERPAVLTGSHDPLLDWAVRESGSGLATLWNGSSAGLQVYAGGEAAVAALHIPEGDDVWNVGSVGACGVTGAVLIAWARRSRGLLVAPGMRDRIASVSELRGRRVAMRQPGAGAAALLTRLLADNGLSETDLQGTAMLARTESDAAGAVAAGEADAALGIAAMAAQFQVGFVPLLDERVDLLVDRRAYFTPPVQALLGFARSGTFAAKAQAMGGYDMADSGVVRWLSP